MRAYFLALTAVLTLAFLGGCSLREPVAPAPVLPPRDALAPMPPPPVGAPKTKRNEDLVVAGGTLIAIGSLASISSTIMAVGALKSSLDSDDGTDPSAPATASLASLALSHALLGSGIPMVVIGVRREPHSPDDPTENRPSRGLFDGSRAPVPGVTTVWSF